MSGVFNQRPPQRKYLFIWDVEVVQKFSTKNNLLSNKTLPFKLVLLLALISASRASEVTDLNLDYLSKSQSVYMFYPCTLTNIWRKGRVPPKPLKLYSFLREKKLCVCATLDNYLSKHESWGTQGSQMLVSFVKPHKAVTSSTVSRWFREGVSMAEIDTKMLKSHSTRATSTTNADVTGVSACDTMKQRQLSSKSTFQNFYKKKSIDHSETF